MDENCTSCAQCNANVSRVNLYIAISENEQKKK